MKSSTSSDKNVQHRRDIKQQTMKRLVGIDANVGPRYEELDNDPNKLNNCNLNAKRPLQLVNRNVNIRCGGGNCKRRSSNFRNANTQRNHINQVIVRNIGSANTQYVMQTLAELVDKFLPLKITEQPGRGGVTFYVISLKEAGNITFFNRRVSHPSSPEKCFTISSSMLALPWEVLNMRYKTAIWDAVKTRYTPISNSVNLAQFHGDQVFTVRNLSACYLNRACVIVECIRATADHFSKITGLSLKANNLKNLSLVHSFVFGCPHVIELDLSDNSLTDIEELRKVNRWKIERLMLLNNPLCLSFPDAKEYKKAIHRFLPWVIYLDGLTVNASYPKLGILSNRFSLIVYPPVRPPYFPDEMLKVRMEQLLSEFYDFYDGLPVERSRQALVNAYDENALFTFAVSQIKRVARRFDEDNFIQCLRLSHNVCHEEKWRRYRDRLIFNGPMPIAVALSQLPQTKHDKSSFLLELLTFRPHMLILTLRGTFHDFIGENQPSDVCKFFQRTFTVVPKDNGKMAIMNDILLFSPISNEELELHNDRLKRMLDTVAGNALSSVLMAGSDANDITSEINGNLQKASGCPIKIESVQELKQEPVKEIKQEPLKEIKQEPLQELKQEPFQEFDPSTQHAMIEAFSQQSGMKPEWALKCLEDSLWNFEAAGNIFNQLREQVPRDAFMQ